MPQDARRPRNLSRRGVLAAGLASGGMLLVPSQAHAQEAEELEPTRATSSFTFDNIFYNQLVTWRNNIGGYVPPGWGDPPTRLYSYGGYVNKPGMHGSGRAIDVASVYFTTSGGSLVKRFDCRYDLRRNVYYASLLHGSGRQTF
jgi:hypothetical protein